MMHKDHSITNMYNGLTALNHAYYLALFTPDSFLRSC